MRLWKLYPRQQVSGGPWDPWYDKAFGFVVEAFSEEDARKFASAEAGDEQVMDWEKKEPKFCPWLDPKHSVCEELVPTGSCGVIIRDFHSA